MMNNRKSNSIDTFSKLSKIAASVFETVHGAKNDFIKFIIIYIRKYCESLIYDMNFVKYEEFEVVKKLAMENKATINELLNQYKRSTKKYVSGVNGIKVKSERTEKDKSIADMKK